MKCKTATVLIAALIVLAACGPRTIKKGFVPRDVEIRAIRLMGEGDLLLREHKDHLAMLKYLEASQLDPYEEAIFNKLGVAYSRLEMYYQAKRAVDRAIGLNKDYSYAYNTKGIVELAEQDLKASERAFRKAIVLAPDVPSFYVNLGFVEFQRGKVSEALLSYRRALALDPEVFESENLVELRVLGENPLSPERYYQMALVFAELESLDLCLKYLQKAISSGFSDFDRLESEPIFEKFRDNEDFQAFIELYGVRG